MYVLVLRDGMFFFCSSFRGGFWGTGRGGKPKKKNKNKNKRKKKKKKKKKKNEEEKIKRRDTHLFENMI